MEVRIEITIGDKFIADRHHEPDDIFRLRTYPNDALKRMQAELMVKMGEAVDRALTELLTKGQVPKLTSFPPAQPEGNPYELKGDVT